MGRKKTLDCVLVALFLAGLSSNFLTEEVHELCGLVFIAAVLAHNSLNLNFYRNFSSRSWANKICVILFGVGLVVLTISGAMLWRAEGNFNWRSVHLGAAVFSAVCLLAHLLTHAKKYIRGKIFYATAILSFVAVVGVIFGMPYLDRWYNEVEVKRAELVSGKKIPVSEKVLTLYFSRVGNTDFPADVAAVSGASVMRDSGEIFGNAQMIAYMAQSIVGGDLLEVQTEKIYPANYSETTQIAKAEFESGELPQIKNLPNLDGYDKIILVYPLWWGSLPKPVESFLSNYDLRDKMIIPIVTHGGGGFGESIDALKNSTNAEISQPLEIYSSDIPASREKILSHLSGVEFSYERSAKVMGTPLTLRAAGKNAKVAVDESFSKINELVEKIRHDVGKLNETAGSGEFVAVSPEVFEMLQISQRYSELTGGAFDVTIGAAVDLWKTARTTEKLPSSSEVDAVKNLVGYQHLHLDESNQSAKLDKFGVKINLGGVGKGYAVDVARKIFAENGISDGLINLGASSIFCFGKKNIGIKNPRVEAEISQIIELENSALSTSGDYEQFFVVAGRRYHHIIDPKTCEPTENKLGSVSVVVPGEVENCGAVADILSTSSFILGEERGKNLAAEIGGRIF